MLIEFAIALRKVGKFSLKPKNRKTLTGVRYFFILIVSFFFIPQETFAQTESNLRAKDSIYYAQPYSLLPKAVIADTISTPPEKSDIETTINYSAKDSIRASVDGKMIWLYGNAKIIYGEIELEAEEITIDYGNNTLTAHGIRDSLGQRIGYPIFKNGAELYETKDIIYNFKTGRARISEVVTQVGEGYVHVAEAFKNEDDELFSRNNSYTTCDLEHPHFVIRSTRSKAIPGDKIVSGPFYMEFNDIPLPIGFLFGMFPQQKESSTSGIIFPSYGEERRRGFNLRNGGYFFDINEYVKLSITGDIYSKGGHALYANSSYAKRYHYTGSFNFSYSKTVTGDKIESPTSANDYRVVWSHSPQSRGNSRFAASVNAATTTFNQNNNLNYGYNTDATASASPTGLSNITANLSSSVSYNKKFAHTPFSLGVNGSMNQNLQTRLVDMPFPNITLNMTNQYPFQTKTGNGGALDNFSVGFSMNATNRITNNLGKLSADALTDSIAPFNFENLPLFLQNSRKGVKYSIPISTSVKMLRYLTLSPSINYDERLYFEKLDWQYNSINGKFVADTIHGVNRISNYSISAGLTTRLYGTYFFKRGKVKAIRHVINPNIGFGLTPDFTTNASYFQKIPDASGKQVLQSRHEGFVYGQSITGRSGAISFGVGNNLEMKVKSEKDSVARKVMLLNNLSINSSYNLVADSFKLAPFSLSANSNILDNLINMNLSASVDPYAYVTQSDGEGKSVERRIDQYAWKGNKLGRITSANLALSSNLNPQARKSQQKSREKIADSNLPDQEKEYMIKNPESYIDFEIPWSVNLSYVLSYSHPLNTEAKINQTLQFSGELALSEKWKINYSSGFDFKSADFTQTTLTIARDLHCWTMRFWYVPFGRYQSYNFTIAVKSSLLKDLKVERRKPYYDNL